MGIGGASGRGLSGDTREEVLDGYDVELGLQIPYMPWARVYGKRYFWDSVLNSEDIKGWTASMEADVYQNLTVEAGWRDDNFSDDEVFMKLSFNFGPGGAAQSACGPQFILYCRSGMGYARYERT